MWIISSVYNQQTYRRSSDVNNVAENLRYTLSHFVFRISPMSMIMTFHSCEVSVQSCHELYEYVPFLQFLFL